MRGAVLSSQTRPEQTTLHLSINVPKRLAIDLSQPASVAIMEELVEWADVLIESYSVGVTHGARIRASA